MKCGIKQINFWIVGVGVITAWATTTTTTTKRMTVTYFVYTNDLVFMLAIIPNCLYKFFFKYPPAWKIQKNEIEIEMSVSIESEIFFRNFYFVYIFWGNKWGDKQLNADADRKTKYSLETVMITSNVERNTVAKTSMVDSVL